MVGIDCQRTAEAVQGLVEPMGLHQRPASLVVGVGMAAIDGESRVRAGDRLLMAAEVAKRARAVDQRTQVRGIQRERGVVAHERLGGRTALAQHVAEIGQHRRLLRAQHE